jgi:HAMP domain-containing protein
VHVDPSSELFSGPLRAFSWLSPGAVEIEIGLAGGDRLAVMASGGLGLSIFGIPPGFWAAVLALLIAAATVLMLRREARPLRDLAESVDRIDPARGDHAIQDAPGSAPEIRALIAAFNRLRERVADLLKARMALIGGISHDPALTRRGLGFAPSSSPMRVSGPRPCRISTTCAGSSTIPFLPSRRASPITMKS